MRHASTRSEKRASQPSAGRAQWSVGSIDEDGMRYGLMTHCLTASTMRIAPAIVTSQSSVTCHGRDIPRVSLLIIVQLYLDYLCHRMDRHASRAVLGTPRPAPAGRPHPRTP